MLIPPSILEQTVLQCDRSAWAKTIARFIAEENYHDAAVFRGFAYEGSATWVGMLYGCSNSMFVDILRYRIGLSPFSFHPETTCPMKSCQALKCQPKVQAGYTHAFDCKHANKTPKHNGALAPVKKFLIDRNAEDILVTTDRAECTFYDEKMKEVIGDIIVKRKIPVPGDLPFLFDFSIINPAAPTYIKTKHTHLVGGAAADAKYEAKIARYKSIEQQVTAIIPVIFESSGRAAQKTTEYFQSLVGEVDSNGEVASLFTRIRVQMMLGNARQLENMRCVCSARTRQQIVNDEVPDDDNEDDDEISGLESDNESLVGALESIVLLDVETPAEAVTTPTPTPTPTPTDQSADDPLNLFPPAELALIPSQLARAHLGRSCKKRLLN